MRLGLALTAVTITATAGCSAGGAAPRPPEPNTPAATAVQPAPKKPVVISMPPPHASGPPCRRDQLVARFGVGGPGLGNIIAGVEIRNDGQRSCTLSGRLTLSAVDSDSTPDPEASVFRKNRRVHYFLRPTTHFSSDRQNFVDLILEGAYRDDPHGPRGLCAPGDEIAPTLLLLGVGHLTFTLRNQDPDNPNGIHAVSGCHGSIGLDNAALPDYDY